VVYQGFLKAFGLQICPFISGLFCIHHRKDDKFMTLFIYVDDWVLTRNDSQLCASFKNYLNQCFQIKDLRALKNFLGIEVSRSPQGLFLCQWKYALDIINECGLLGSKPMDSHMQINHKACFGYGCQLVRCYSILRLMGRLTYLTITHPELSCVVYILSQFMKAPWEDHLDAARRVLRYLKGSPHQGILLRSDSHLPVTAYYDSD